MVMVYVEIFYEYVNEKLSPLIIMLAITINYVYVDKKELLL